LLNLSKMLTGAESFGDKLRYSKDSQQTRTGTHSNAGPVIVWNATKACNLSCQHCYAGSDKNQAVEELSTAEARDFLEQLKDIKTPVLLISGGEPLMRDDMLELIEYARNLGIRVTLSTNGTLLTADISTKLKKLGVSYIGISIDGLASTHNKFRGTEKAYSQALRGIKNCQQVGQRVGLRFTMTADNITEIPAIFDLMLEEEIERLCFYHLVHQGRGSKLNSSSLTAAETRETIDYIINRSRKVLARNSNKEILTVANHVDGIYLYLQLLAAQDPRANKVKEYLKYNGGNRSGIAIGCVDWAGNVYPDQFTMNYKLGNITERPLKEIWKTRPPALLKKFREKEKHLKGNCSGCNWLDFCNGNFRARAEALKKDLWAEDPGCYLTAEELNHNVEI